MKKGNSMNRREFLEKFVALSSASLILSGCMPKEENIPYPETNDENVKFKDIISESNGDRAVPVYGPPPIAPAPNNNGFRPIIQQKR